MLSHASVHQLVPTRNDGYWLQGLGLPRSKVPTTMQFAPERASTSNNALPPMRWDKMPPDASCLHLSTLLSPLHPTSHHDLTCSSCGVLFEEFKFEVQPKRNNERKRWVGPQASFCCLHVIRTKVVYPPNTYGCKPKPSSP